jgi:hypothetical protein
MGGTEVEVMNMKCCMIFAFGWNIVHECLHDHALGDDRITVSCMSKF